MAKNKVIFGNTTIMDITDTTAEANDVVSGKQFYDKSGVKTTGALVVPHILYGTNAPTSNEGEDGDLYIQYNEV